MKRRPIDHTVNSNKRAKPSQLTHVCGASKPLMMTGFALSLSEILRDPGLYSYPAGLLYRSELGIAMCNEIRRGGDGEGNTGYGLPQFFHYSQTVVLGLRKRAHHGCECARGPRPTS